MDSVQAGADKKTVQVTPQSVARAEYERVFGEGAFALLQATSTLMPARDMALTVDRFWSLDGASLGIAAASRESTDDAKREGILIDVLTRIGNKVYAAVPEANRHTRATPEQIARCFIPDLVHPAPQLNLSELVFQQLDGYARTKVNARRTRGAPVPDLQRRIRRRHGIQSRLCGQPRRSHESCGFTRRRWKDCHLRRLQV